MTVYQPGDLILVAFPFSSGASVKARPALVAAVLQQVFGNWK